MVKTSIERAQAEAAAEVHAAATTRLREAEAAAAQATEDLEGVDVDDAKAMARAVAVRDAAVARVEVLAVRAAKASKALEAANERASAAERAVRTVELSELDAQLAARDSELTRRVLAFKASVAAEIEALRELVSRANALQREVGGFDPQIHRRRGARWLEAAPVGLLIAATEGPAPRS